MQDGTSLSVNVSMSWSLAVKEALSFYLLITCVAKIFTVLHDREKTLNKISLVPIYMVTGQSFGMIIYFALFAICNIRSLEP